MNVYIRVNGRGNAWPIELGSHNYRHTQHRYQPQEYANTSLSILGIDGEPQNSNVRWEVLFDIGQGIVPFLVQNGNRLPDAVILSHSHLDHIAGLYWLIPSYRRNRFQDRPLPVYTSKRCWNAVLDIFGFLKKDIEWRELVPGQRQIIEEAPGLSATSFPVFHGEHAPGSSLVLFEYTNQNNFSHKAIFTGDLLCPLLRKRDIKLLQGSDVMYVDANTRFPCPQTNHWSIVPYTPSQDTRDAMKAAWKHEFSPSCLVAPHWEDGKKLSIFLKEFVDEIKCGENLYMSIFDFVKILNFNNVNFVHYSGYEDIHYYKQDILDDQLLLKWTQQQAKFFEIAPKWSIPKPGNYFLLSS